MVRQATHGRRGGFASDEPGVSSVVGEILMVAVFITLAGFAASIVWPGEPARTLHADLVFDLACTDGAWGDGNDVVVLQHRGGEAVERDLSEVVITVDGVETRLGPAELAGAFSDGLLATGEAWSHATPLGPSSDVRVEVVYEHLHGETQLRAAVLEDRTCA